MDGMDRERERERRDKTRQNRQRGPSQSLLRGAPIWLVVPPGVTLDRWATAHN